MRSFPVRVLGDECLQFAHQPAQVLRSDREQPRELPVAQGQPCGDAGTYALERQGPYAVPHLTVMLGASDPELVMFALQSLTRIGYAPAGRSILPLLYYRNWRDEDAIDLREADVSVYLRGDNLRLEGALCYFWVNSPGTRWHLTSHPIAIPEVRKELLA